MRRVVLGMVGALGGWMLVGLVGVASAVPAAIPYNGLLAFEGGGLFDGTIDVEVNAYDSITAGNLVAGPFVFSGQPVDEGVLSLVLGNSAAGSLADAALGTDELWLEFTLDSTLMSPRQQVLSVPYATRASEADMVGGLLPTDLLQQGDVDIDGSLETDGPLTVGGQQVVDSSGNWVGPDPWSDNGGTVSTTRRVGVGITGAASPVHAQTDESIVFAGRFRNDNAAGRGLIVESGDGTGNEPILRLGDANGGPALIVEEDRDAHLYGTTFLQTPDQQPFLRHAQTGDGFEATYDNNFFGSNVDALVITKTDGNGQVPDGGIAFVNRSVDSGTVFTSTAMAIRGNGRVGIGTENPATTLQVNGTARWNCPANTARVGNWCIDSTRRSAQIWFAAASDCHDERRTLCPIKVLQFCDLNLVEGTSDCLGVLDSATTRTWTSDTVIADGVDPFMGCIAYGGDNTLNAENCSTSSTVSHEYYCCSPVL